MDPDEELLSDPVALPVAPCDDEEDESWDDEESFDVDEESFEEVPEEPCEEFSLEEGVDVEEAVVPGSLDSLDEDVSADWLWVATGTRDAAFVPIPCPVVAKLITAADIATATKAETMAMATTRRWIAVRRLRAARSRSTLLPTFAFASPIRGVCEQREVASTFGEADLKDCVAEDSSRFGTAAVWPSASACPCAKATVASSEQSLPGRKSCSFSAEADKNFL